MNVHALKEISKISSDPCLMAEIIPVKWTWLESVAKDGHPEEKMDVYVIEH